MIKEKCNVNVRFQNFIVFEQNISRIPDENILIKNSYEIVDIVNKAKASICEYSLQDLIVLNRIEKLEKFLEISNDFVMTKFYDRLWRSYSSLNHIGESFLSLDFFKRYFEEYEALDVIANR